MKCNAFSGIPAVRGCSKLFPSASCNTVQISFWTAQLQRRWLNVKAGSLLEQPVHLKKPVSADAYLKAMLSPSGLDSASNSLPYVFLP